MTRLSLPSPTPQQHKRVNLGDKTNLDTVLTNAASTSFPYKKSHSCGQTTISDFFALKPLTSLPSSLSSSLHPRLRKLTIPHFNTPPPVACAPNPKPKRYEQLFLDLGQRNFGATTCPECQMSYNRGQGEDDTIHEAYHRAAVGGIDYPGYKNEIVVDKDNAGGRIVMITHRSSAHEKKKLMCFLIMCYVVEFPHQLQDILKTVNTELGSVELPEERLEQCKAFIYVSAKKKTLGCVVAERIESAYRVVPVGEGDEEDGVKEGGEEEKGREEGKDEEGKDGKGMGGKEGKGGKSGKDEEEGKSRKMGKDEEGKNKEERKDDDEEEEEEEEENLKERKKMEEEKDNEEKDNEEKDGKREKNDEEGKSGKRDNKEEERKNGGKGKNGEKGKSGEKRKSEDQSGDGKSQNMGADGVRAKETRRDEEGVMQIQDGGLDVSSAIFCSTKSVPAVCGISRIWVSRHQRGRGIATRLLEVVRTRFVFGCTLDRGAIAFSQPTGDGKKLAVAYVGTRFLVYTENEWDGRTNEMEG
ncbi:ESCO1/2 acetyl-transferase-domain-containing protein [Endogone sp. FLAS-F59071]|nr:ESCO1/2 acetyl-transferase-domain-containing protein [Endogone sp. FLAS-F59071]|eukprot:RUS18899.1 ESCO1/2 acetyl-transferase-domain-containing protein [Endogone sp. FLAS-F59071]